MANPPSKKPPFQRGSGSRFTEKSNASPLIKALLILMVVVGLLFAMLVAYAFIIAKPNLPNISALVEYNPKEPLRIYTADKVLIGEFGEERRNVVPLNEIPVHLKYAVIAIEDDRFYSHGGVDYWGVLRAALANLRGSLSQGASTITMQVARNFFLTNEKTFSRKLYEVLLAWEIEAQLTKDKILEIYMNQIYLGQRAYGFASASKIYFGKELKDISIAEAAMLAGLPKAPSAYNPVNNYKRAKIRQEYILQRMRDLSYITPANYEKAMAESIKIRGLGKEFDTRADFVAEMARQLLFAQYGDIVYSQGINVYTTVLKADQDAAYAAVRGAVVRLLNDDGVWKLAQLPQVEAAFVALDPNDGAILALVGGFDFRRNKFNHVTQAFRQPGSAFKPFVYAAALEKGISPSTMVNDAPLSIGALETGSQVWQPKNYDGKFDGMMRLRTALAKSKNLVSVRVIRKIGPSYTQEFIQRFGFEPEKHPPYLTMALGAGSVTPLQMASAYSVFANGGYFVNPYLIDKVTDAKGQILFQADPVRVGKNALRVLDERTTFVMDSMLQEITKTGTAARARPALGRNDIAGKTGTTNDSHDAWFAGYNPRVSAVAWIGFDNPKSLGDRETGGGLALPVWINFMSVALRGVPEINRAPPPGVSEYDGDWIIPEFAPLGGVRQLN
ncbi:MAG: PBP1A family penicillin-binding protein [Burkholderiaceae bacterium]|nr:PBP1A family penicillin-binding protein [Burkholderiaceae bacterium]